MIIISRQYALAYWLKEGILWHGNAVFRQALSEIENCEAVALYGE